MSNRRSSWQNKKRGKVRVVKFDHDANRVDCPPLSTMLPPPLPLSAAVALLPLIVIGNTAAATIEAAIQLDQPPFITANGQSGGVVDIILQSLPQHEVALTQITRDAVGTAIERGVASMSIPAFHDEHNTHGNDDVQKEHISMPFIAYQNVAFTKSGDNLTIDTIQDLDDYGPVLTWQDAVHDLGFEFESLFTNNSKYTPIGNQTEQVELFWSTPDSVVVIDSTLFSYFNEVVLSKGDVSSLVTLHDVFPSPVTTMSAGFADPEMRDEFDDGLHELCMSGAYNDIVANWELKYDPQVICGQFDDGDDGDGGSSAADPSSGCVLQLSLLALAPLFALLGYVG